MVSPAATQFWAEVARQPNVSLLDDGRVWVPSTQAGLAEQYGCSPGTVGYYRREADGAVQRGDGGLLLDVGVLEAAAGSGGMGGQPRQRRSRDQLLAAWETRQREDGSELLIDGLRSPTEAAAAEVWGISRTAAHGRLVRLEAAGLLARPPGQGWLLPGAVPPGAALSETGASSGRPDPAETPPAAIPASGTREPADEAEKPKPAQPQLESVMEAIAAGFGRAVLEHVASPSDSRTNRAGDARTKREQIREAEGCITRIVSRISRDLMNEKTVSELEEDLTHSLLPAARDQNAPSSDTSLAPFDSERNPNGTSTSKEKPQERPGPVRAPPGETLIGPDRAGQLMAPVIRVTRRAGREAWLPQTILEELGHLSETQLRSGIANALAGFDEGRGKTKNPVPTIISKVRAGVYAYFSAPRPAPPYRPPQDAPNRDEGQLDRATHERQQPAERVVAQLETDPNRKTQLELLDRAINAEASHGLLKRAGGALRHSDRIDYVKRWLEQHGQGELTRLGVVELTDRLACALAELDNHRGGNRVSRSVP